MQILTKVSKRPDHWLYCFRSCEEIDLRYVNGFLASHAGYPYLIYTSDVKWAHGNVSNPFLSWYHVTYLTIHLAILLCYDTVYPKKYAHGFVVLCFVVVMQSFIMNSHEVFIHIYQGCFAGTGVIVRLPQCQWSKPDGYGEISQCITITKHSKAKTVCIFLGIYCMYQWNAVSMASSVENLYSTRIAVFL